LQVVEELTVLTEQPEQQVLLDLLVKQDLQVQLVLQAKTAEMELMALLALQV
jgi:hypothetical protein